MLRLGVLRCALIRLLRWCASQQGCFYYIDGSWLLMQSSCSCGGVHPHNAFPGLVHTAVTGRLLGLPQLIPGGAHLSPAVCFSQLLMLPQHLSALSRLDEWWLTFTAENRCGFRRSVLHRHLVPACVNRPWGKHLWGQQHQGGGFSLTWNCPSTQLQPTG